MSGETSGREMAEDGVEDIVRGGRETEGGLSWENGWARRRIREGGS
jgi:hypothetical protein